MKKFCLIICLPALLLSGCVEPIVLDPGELGSGDENRPIVAECLLHVNNVNRPQELRLLYVKGKSESKDVPVEEEKMAACLIDGNDSIPFLYKGDGIWKTVPVRIKPYHRYKLYIEIPDKGKVLRSETVTPPSISLSTGASNQISREMSLRLKNSDDRKFPPEALSNCAVWFKAFEDTPSGTVPLKYLATNIPYVDEVTLTRKKFSDLDFVGDPDPEDFLGAYYKAVFDRAKEYIPDHLLYEDFIRISAEKEVENFSIFAGPLTIPGQSPGGGVPNDDSGYAFLRMCVVDKSLDQFLRSVYVYNQTLKSDLSFLYSTSRDIYSNIEYGFGIFGSYYTSGVAFLRSAFTDELWRDLFQKFDGDNKQKYDN